MCFIVTNRSLPNERVPAFYNDRGTAEQHIKEGKHALKRARLAPGLQASIAFRSVRSRAGHAPSGD